MNAISIPLARWKAARGLFPLSLVALAFLLASGCGDKSEFEKNENQAVAPKPGGDDGDSGDALPKDRRGGRDGGDKGGDAKDDEGDDAGLAGDDGSGTDGDGGEGDGSGDGEGFDGEEFFLATIKPMFIASCDSCHADPRFPVDTRGPLSIFSYGLTLPMLMDGNATGNTLIDKMTGGLSHGGGNRCPDGLDKTPCKEVLTWWNGENGVESDTPSAAGEVNPVTVQGRVSGHAFDSMDEAATVPVRLYVDGATSPLSEITADQAGFDGGKSGNHAFAVNLPADLLDGTEHTLRAFAVIGGEEVELKGSPVTFTSYSKTDAGRTFFQNNLQNAMTNTCGGCHAISYDAQWANLVTPSPAGGGTATTNRLITKGSGGGGHGGGNQCGGINGGPCAAMQDWWDIEFGN